MNRSDDDTLKDCAKECFIPEKDVGYPLCIGRDKLECEECQLKKIDLAA